ncbi:MAG: TonB-dependent receptor [Bryobacteraceae bacterium]|nr:TonB-dependent receptor [Bryobacteraceae bacterium]
MRILRLALAAVLYAASLLSQSPAAAQLFGVVTDPTGAVIAGARITLMSGSVAVSASQTTDREGRFRFGPLRPGGYTLLAVKTDFAPQRVPITVPAGETLERNLTLTVSSVEADITVTAETSMVESTDQVAQRLNVISGEMAEERVATTTVEAVREEAGVDVQRTSSAMGGIAVRGLVGRNVAVFRDGIRYTTSAQRGGVSTFLNLNEFSGLESLEILRGPNSAQYGSDSIGGTVNFQSRAAPLGGSRAWHGEFAPMYSSATHGWGANLLTTFSSEKFGIVANLAGRRVNTLRTGGGIDSRAAVTRFLGLPSTIFGERLPDTAFTQYGGSLHAQLSITPREQLVAHYERNQQDGSNRYDQLLGGDGNLIASVRNLMLDFGYLRYTRFAARWVDQASVTVSYNTQREERVNQGGLGNPNATITSQYERMKVWGTNFFVTKRIAANDLLVGGDGYWERAVAPSYTLNPATGVAAPSRGRIPDGAVYRTYGLFAQDVWEPFASRKLRVTGALRLGGASYRSRAENAPAVNGRPLFPSDSATANAVVGRAGLIYAPVESIRIFFQYSQGFRAPNITDLGTVGLQGNGFFEGSFADLAGRGALLGTRADELAVSSGRPVSRVRPERSGNYDFGFSLRAGRVRTETGGFWINLSDVIVSQTLILPPGAVGAPLGDQVITRQLPTGAVFVPLSPAAVQIRGNLGAAQTYGVEHQLEYQISRSWSAAGNVTWLYARDRQSGLPPDIEGGTPPLLANFRLRYAPGRRLWLEAYGTLAGRQDRLSSLALADRRTGAARSRTNIANFFHNGARVRGLVANGILLPTGETLAQAQNRVLGSAISAPLFPAVPGWGMWGVRGSLRISERCSVFADLQNLFDRNYRGVSSGIDGPGRGLTLRYRYQF